MVVCECVKGNLKCLNLYCREFLLCLICTSGKGPLKYAEIISFIS